MQEQIVRIIQKEQIISLLLEFQVYFPSLKNNQDLTKRIAQKIYLGGCLLLYEMNGEHAGIAAFYANDYNTYKAYLSLLAVKEQFQGHGIGRALIEDVQSIALTAGMRELILEVRLNNHSAIGFYEYLGFKQKEDAELLTIRLGKQLFQSNDKG